MEVELKAKAIHCYSNSQLVVNQVLGEYQARVSKMVAYLDKVKAALGQFEYYRVEQIPREDNTMADALARLATSREANELNIVPIEVLLQPSISKPEEVKLLNENVT